MAGTLTDTYVAALQHDIADVPRGARLIGVVRKPTPWFHGAVDENRPALGPPLDQLETLQDHQERLAARGICEEEAHNAAWEEFDFATRYREYLTGEEPQEAIADVLALLADDTDVALVCYENTENKRCHRTLLCEELQSRR